MALFQGDGVLILNGTAARIHDVNFAAAGGGLRLDDNHQDARNINGPLSVLGDNCAVTESLIRSGTWVGEQGQVKNTHITVSLTVTGDYMRVQDCFFDQGDGLTVNANQAQVQGNLLYRQGSTDDGVAIDGDRNLVQGNRFVPNVGVTNSAVNIVGGNCNMVVGNDLGDPADYATDALIDSGIDTQVFYPADIVYGDNFTICPPGSA